MKRRHLITALASAASGAAIVGILNKKKPSTVKPNPHTLYPTPALLKGRQQLRMVTAWPKNFPGLGIMANRFAQGINTLSEGVIEVKVYAAGELVGALQCFDAVSTGAADIYHAAEYYWTGKSKAFAFFTAVPMGMTTAEIIGWIEYGGGQAFWDSLSARFNIKAMLCGNTGHQTGGWFKREINHLEDFQGLKMRIPGLGGEVIRRLGAAPVSLPGGEIYQALQSGAIDATEWVGPWNDLAFGFYREAPYYYVPGFHEPGAALSVGFNLDIWNKFTDVQKKMIQYAAKAANEASIGEYTYQNGHALEILKREHNIFPKFFSDTIMIEIGKQSEAVVAELGQSDKLGIQIYNSYLAVRKESRRWTEISDGAYITARKKALDSIK